MTQSRNILKAKPKITGHSSDNRLQEHKQVDNTQGSVLSD